MSKQLYKQTTFRDISDRLRAIRISRGLSLADIEKSSRGTFKAATLGSYERADRSLTISRAIEIAEFYHIPLSQLLLGTERNQETLEDSTLIFDLRRIRQQTEGDTEIAALTYFLGEIARRRSDWNGEVLSIRANDMTTLSILLRIPEFEVLRFLDGTQLLLKRI
jgi:transcriptional regulator with XRE-family HTH domain